jgi:hypothetical protein
MTAVLLRLSFAAGTVLALAAFILGLLGGASLAVALYRAAVVLVTGSMLVAVFFRRFTLVLYNFVAQRMAEESSRQPDGAAPRDEARPSDRNRGEP